MKDNKDLINEETIKKLVGKHITFLIYSLDNNDNPIFNRDYDTLTGKLVSYKNGKLYIDLEVIQDIETEDLTLNHTNCLYDIAVSDLMEVIYNGLDEELVNAPSIKGYNLSQMVRSNTLFIYDNDNLRRMHLLQTLGNLIRNNNSEKGIAYISENNFNSSLEIYKYLDVLIIDDIQNISDKKQLSKILDVLQKNKKQIIIGSSKSTEELNELPSDLLNLIATCEIININEYKEVKYEK